MSTMDIYLYRCIQCTFFPQNIKEAAGAMCNVDILQVKKIKERNGNIKMYSYKCYLCT